MILNRNGIYTVDQSALTLFLIRRLLDIGDRNNKHVSCMQINLKPAKLNLTGLQQHIANIYGQPVDYVFKLGKVF